MLIAQHRCNCLQSLLLLFGARQLPDTEPKQQPFHGKSKYKQYQTHLHPITPVLVDNGKTTLLPVKPMEKLLIIAFVLLILWNLGAGLYYMMVDKGKTDRTVKSLSWRIGLSVLLIALVIVGIYTGVIKPHGIQG